MGNRYGHISLCRCLKYFKKKNRQGGRQGFLFCLERLLGFREGGEAGRTLCLCMSTGDLRHQGLASWCCPYSVSWPETCLSPLTEVESSSEHHHSGEREGRLQDTVLRGALCPSSAKERLTGLGVELGGRLPTAFSCSPGGLVYPSSRRLKLGLSHLRLRV